MHRELHSPVALDISAKCTLKDESLVIKVVMATVWANGDVYAYVFDSSLCAPFMKVINICVTQ